MHGLGQRFVVAGSTFHTAITCGSINSEPVDLWAHSCRHAKARDGLSKQQLVEHEQGPACTGFLGERVHTYRYIYNLYSSKENFYNVHVPTSETPHTLWVSALLLQTKIFHESWPHPHTHLHTRSCLAPRLPPSSRRPAAAAATCCPARHRAVAAAVVPSILHGRPRDLCAGHQAAAVLPPLLTRLSCAALSKPSATVDPDAGVR